MATTLEVTGTEAVTPDIRRVWFRAVDAAEFADAFGPSAFTDRYVKLAFAQADGDPVVRTYTALFPDTDAATLAIDFVVHGDQGVAGPWAQRARAGDRLDARGPGGAYRPDPTADWHLLAGDESAVPALTAALADLAVHAPDAVVRVVVLVQDSDAEPALPPLADLPGAEVELAHRSAGASLAEAVRAVAWLPGRVQAFVHGEAQEVMHGVRPYLLQERGLERDQVSVSGYWRRGRTEEGFREWKRDLAQRESAT